MKVLCWNVRGGGKPSAWAMVKEFAPDVALLQEATVPESLSAQYEVFTRTPISRRLLRQRWMTAVLVRRGTEARARTFKSNEMPWLGELLEESGCCAAVNLSVGRRSMLLVSIYSPAWPLPLVQRLSEAQLAQVRLPTHTGHDVWVADLLWAWLRSLSAKPTVIAGGDFNSTPAFDREHGGKSRGNVVQHQRFVDGGLRDLVQRLDPDFRQTPTFRHARGKLYQLDYLYVSSELEPDVVTVRLGTPDIWTNRVSDHLPIMIDFAPELP